MNKFNLLDFNRVRTGKNNRRRKIGKLKWNKKEPKCYKDRKEGNSSKKWGKNKQVINRDLNICLSKNNKMKL